jgi:2-dehydropantoate 2-reductase
LAARWEYVQLPQGREVFEKTYTEALNVVLTLGEQPETMLVEPIPPSRTGSVDTSQAYDGWFQQILDNYGDTKPSMLQDFERGRPTEIDFINGYVVGLGKQNGINVVFNEVIVAIVKAIAGGDSRPSADHLSAIIARAS